MNTLRLARAPHVLALLLTIFGLYGVAPAAAQQDLFSITPCRVYDSRSNGGPLNQGTEYTVPVAGTCGIPANATAVSVNLTIVGATGTGELWLYPAGGSPPSVSVFPFSTGRTLGTFAVVPLGTGGAITATAAKTPTNPGLYQLVLDITGYFLGPPVAVDDPSYATEKDTPLNIAAATGVLSNDTLNGATIVSYGATTGGEQTTIGTATPTSAGGSITLSANGSFSYTPPSGAVSINDTFKYILQNASGTSTATVTIGVGKLSQTIMFTSTAPTDAKVGGPTYTVTATATSGLPVTFSIDALAVSVCTIAGSTVSFIGVGTCIINADQAGDTSYNPAPQVQQSFAVAKGDQTISFTSAAPSDAKVGGPTYTVTATASSGLPVTFTIDPSASAVCSIAGSTVSFLSVGTCVINANQAGDANWNAAPQAQQSFPVGKGDQTITFTSTAPSDATVNGPTYTVTATSSSGLPVTFAIDASATAVCSIAGSTVSFLSSGTCVINANQAGDANYNPAPQVQQSFSVGKASQTISFTSTAPVNAKVGGPTYTVTATATSGLTVAFTIDPSASTVCTIAGSTVSFIGVGTCVINANQPGDASYAAAPQEQQSFPVAKGDQTISFTSTAPVNAKVGGPTYTVTATATSGLPVTFSIDASASSVCSIAGSTVSFLSVGTCVINANQPGDANWNAASQAQQSFPVNPGDQTISFTSTAPVNAKVNGPTYTVTATATSGLPVTFSIDASAASVCTIVGSTVSFIGAGTCVINANQAGDANYNPAPQAQQSFPVAKGDQAISFTSAAPINAKFGGPTYTVSATATSGLTVIFSIDPSAASVCSVAGSTVSFIGAGTCVINANQPGDANWNTAPQVQQSFLVDKADQTVSFTSTPPALAQIGGPTYTVTATATSGLPVVFTIDASATSVCSVVGSTVSFLAGGNCVINANQPGNANWNAAPQVQQTVPVNFRPVVPDANYVTPGNTQLHVAGATPLPGVASWTDAVGLLAKSGASDPDSRPAASLSVISASGTSANGGTYSIDGITFTYVPPAGFAGTDSFPFQVTDGLDTTTGSVKIAVGPRVWYIHDVTSPNNPAGGDGRSTNPFDSVAAFNAATTFDNDIIFVFEGNTGTTPHVGSFTLKNGQKLWGQGIALNVPGFGTPLVNATNKPRIRTTTVSTDVVAVPATAGSRSNVEIRGLDLEATGGSIGAGNASNAIDVTATGGNTVGVTISNNNIRGATGEGIDLNSGATVAFDATVQNNTITAIGNGIDTRVSSTGTATVTASSNMITSTAGNAVDARTLAGASALRVAFNDSNVAASGTGILIDGSAAGTTTITSFLNNVVDANTVGTGMSIVSAIFDGTPGGTFQTIAAGTTVVGASGNGVGGAGMVLTNVQGDLSFADLDIFAEGGAALRASSTAAYTGSAGLRMVVGAGVGIIEANGGPAVDITQATITLPLSSIKSTNSATTGLALNSVAGSFSAGSGSTITGSSGTGFQVGSSNATITYDGTITTTTGKGVDLTSNTGSTISFTGALALSSGAQTAFNATGGGTVTSTHTSSTLTATTGSALNVVNTTIGAGGLNFRSISAGTGAGSSGNGISLDNTGTAAGNGSLIVSGSGTAGSGGTIQHKTGGDGSTTSGIGIYLNNTKSPSFSRMQLNHFDNFAIRGSGVQGFTLSNSVINGVNGNNDGVDEAAVRFDNLLVSGLIDNCTIEGGVETNVRVINNTGTLNALVIQNSTIRSNSTTTGGDGVFARAQTGATMTVKVLNSILYGHRDDHIATDAENSGVMNTVITGNTLTSNGTVGAPPQASTLGGQITVTGGAAFTGTSTYNISNNVITGAVPAPITVNVVSTTSTAGGLLSGTISGNQLGQAGSANSGSSTSDGLSVLVNGAATINATITNNQIRQFNNIGMQFIKRDGSGNMNLTVTGNTIAEPVSPNALQGILVTSGATSGPPADSGTVCANIGGAGALVNTVTGPNFGGDLIRVRQRFSTFVQLPGYGGGSTDTTAVANYLIGRNTITNEAPNAKASASTQAPGSFTSGAACTAGAAPL